MSYQKTFDFNNLNEEEITQVLHENTIALTKEEALKIQNEILHRPPTLSECILWSIQGSEHCSYKSSRPFLKQFVTEAPNVILGPKEDAGIVEIATDNQGFKYGLVVSHESHNSPSQIVPYEGAATGVGGNVRDVSCMGARVIGVSDSLRFGEIDSNKTKWISKGVVEGIAGYGNPIGVPNVGGDIYFDETYKDNCLVNVVTLGILREDEIIHSYAPGKAEGYDLILVGKPTDNSGFGGASFSSAEVKEDEKEANKGAVQEPNAFLKRHLLKATYTLFQALKAKGLLDKVGLKDLGAGGIACASVELADGAGYGAEVFLDQVFTDMEDLDPAVILCSETQERYMWVAHPEVTPLILENYNQKFDLSHVSRGAKAAVIGKITQKEDFKVTYKGENIVYAKACDVTSGLLYNREYTEPKRTLSEPEIELVDGKVTLRNQTLCLSEVLLQILAHPNVCSKLPVYENYDKNVQGISVIEPGEADASVLQPFIYHNYPDEIKQVGVSFKVDHNPRYGKISPYWVGVNSVAECLRNLAAVGSSPQALTDCLNFGNPEKSEQMWDFVESVRGVAEACKKYQLKENPEYSIPIVSGNVSLYKESKGRPIAPSPIISGVGKIRDVRQALTQNFQKPGSILLLLGERKDECGGSVYYDLFDMLGVNVPKPDFGELQISIYGLVEAAENNLILSCHDISDGGLAACLLEMSFKNGIGLEVEVKQGGLREDKVLFGETGGFVLEVDEKKLQEVQTLFERLGLQSTIIGKTTDSMRIIINQSISLDLSQAKEVWENSLRERW